MSENKDICPCKFNFFVDCEEQTKCDKCGWNPAVHNKRIEKFKSEEGIKNE